MQGPSLDIRIRRQILTSEDGLRMSKIDVYRRQIMMSIDGPSNERIKISIMGIDPQHRCSNEAKIPTKKNTTFFSMFYT